MNANWLDPEICCKFRNVINSSNIFLGDASLRENWNLTCAVMDRLSDVVEYLNENFYSAPQTSNDFIIFMTYADMLVGATKELLKKFNKKYDDTTYLYSSYYNFIEKRKQRISSYEAEKNIYIGDDSFFKYIRCLTFAHPYETSSKKNYKFLLDGEVNYSPFVFDSGHYMSSDKIIDPVGLNIYSNKFDGSMGLWISFNDIKEYIKSKYNLLILATEWASEKIAYAETEWGNRKINRNKTKIEMLKDGKDILEHRYVSTHEIDEAIELLECECTLISNSDAVNKYKEHIKSCIPSLCDQIDNFNIEYKYPTPIMKALSPKPKNTCHMFDYYTSKIYSGLTGSTIGDNNYYGRSMAKLFAQGFVKDYVTIDYDNMSATEIRLLVNTACYLEKLSQRYGKIHPSITKSIEEHYNHMKKLVEPS